MGKRPERKRKMELTLTAEKAKVTVELERYTELIEAETRLKILCAQIAYEKPYHMQVYANIAGEYMPIWEEEKKEVQ